MADEQKSKQHEATGGGQTPPARTNLYAQISRHAPRAIEELVKLLDSRNESIRLGAINKILDKAIPDLKAMEVTGKDGGPIKLTIIGGADYVSYTGKTTPAPAEGSITPVGAF